MSNTCIRRKKWLKKRIRTKKSLGVLGKYPRLVVFKSNRHIYSQLLDDNKSITLFSSSSKDRNFKIGKNKTKIDISKDVGANIADKIIKNKINKIIFDRNGYKYHGRIKALADSIRKKGINF